MSGLSKVAYTTLVPEAAEYYLRADLAKKKPGIFSNRNFILANIVFQFFLFILKKKRLIFNSLYRCSISYEGKLLFELKLALNKIGA